MQFTVSQDAAQCHVELSGPFTFADHQDFRSVLVNAENPVVKTMTLNLHNVTFMDSAALGMLLLLRDKAEEQGITVTLANAQGQVRQLLSLSQFEKLFTMVG